MTDSKTLPTSKRAWKEYNASMLRSWMEREKQQGRTPKRKRCKGCQALYWPWTGHLCPQWASI